MNRINQILLVILFLFSAFKLNDIKGEKVVQIFLIGDSTMTDYSLEENYDANRYPLTGWGQVFQSFFGKEKLDPLKHLLKADSVRVIDKAKGGRSTRTFFQEGRWEEVYEALHKKDIVLIQFGHNDASVKKTERYVNEQGYKQFLKLYVQQTREKEAIPILLTPVARNYPWEDGQLNNVHGKYPDAMKSVAEEMNVLLVDLNQLSMDFFSLKGKDYVTEKYFMNLPANMYKAYPEGKSDNTHFQPEGAKEVARLVFEALVNLKNKMNE